VSGAGDRLAACWARSPSVVARRLEGEYVLIPLADGGADLDGVRNLNPVAAFVWERLDGRTSGAEVVEAVVARFEVTRERAEQDYLELVETLAGIGVLVPPASLTGVRGGG
jgi:hypothetical protein